MLFRSIALALGASELIIDDCVLYGRVIMFALTFFMLQNSFQGFLIAAEKPNFGMVIAIATGVTNIVLDFVFILILNMGLFGAALATTIS